MLLESPAGVAEAIRVARLIETAFQAPCVVEGQEVFATPSIGIAPGTAERDGPDDLIRIARAALFRARASGVSQHDVYDALMHASTVARLQTESELRRALQRDALDVAYQPIVRLDTGSIAGFEALARWKHPDLGEIPPANFICVAEETGLIVQLDRWVLRQACTRIRGLQLRHPDRPLTISVNVSGRQFTRPDMLEYIDSVLAETGMDARALRLEITESVLVEPTGVAVRLFAALRERGIQLAIDDFGTGYSSLSYLQRLPVQWLKIDRAFMAGRKGDREIVRAIVTLAHSLGKEVVAEGVEEPETLEELRALGCEYGQGFLFSPPVSGATLDRLLERS